MAKDDLVMFSHEFDGVEHLIAKDQFGIDRDFIRPNNIMVISENNTYPVADCKQVEVQLPEQKAVKLKIAENGEFTPDTYSGEYYDEVTVQMATELTDEEITITENGTYKPSTGKMFSKVTVDVPCDTMVGYDEWGNPVTPYVDPTTGKLEIDKLPDHIKVTKRPTKTDYIFGEKIDYSGIEVRAYNKDGSLWTKMGYQNGIIPPDELIYLAQEIGSVVKDNDVMMQEIGSSGIYYTISKNGMVYQPFDAEDYDEDYVKLEYSFGCTVSPGSAVSRVRDLSSYFTADNMMKFTATETIDKTMFIYKKDISNKISPFFLFGTVISNVFCICIAWETSTKDLGDHREPQNQYADYYYSTDITQNLNGVFYEGSVGFHYDGKRSINSLVAESEGLFEFSDKPRVPCDYFDEFTTTGDGDQEEIIMSNTDHFFYTYYNVNGRHFRFLYWRRLTPMYVYSFAGNYYIELAGREWTAYTNSSLWTASFPIVSELNKDATKLGEILAEVICENCANYIASMISSPEEYNNPQYKVAIPYNCPPIYQAQSGLDCGITQPIIFASWGIARTGIVGSVMYEYNIDGAPVTFAYSEGSAGFYFVVASQDRNTKATITVKKYNVITNELISEDKNAININTSYSHNDKTVYFFRGTITTKGLLEIAVPVATTSQAGLFRNHEAQIAWTMIYGENITETTKVSQPVRVQWKRPSDKKTLETSMELNVLIPKVKRT